MAYLRASVLRYIGSKAWLTGLVGGYCLPFVPLFVEPFCGSAVIGLTMLIRGLCGSLVIGDLDDNIAAFWESVLGDTEGLI